LNKLNPGNSTAAQDTAGAVFDQILQMSKEEQLQAQRDIATEEQTPILATKH